MLDEYLEGYRDPQAYDLEDGGYDADVPLTLQLAEKCGNPVLDLACGTGTMALRLAEKGYQMTGVDIVPEMIAWSEQKAAAKGASVEWVVGDARSFQLHKQFRFIYMLGNAFQHFLTRKDHEAMLGRVREHLHSEGCFLFGTRNPNPRNLLEARYTEPQTYPTADGGRLVASEQQQYDPISQIQHYTFLNRWFNGEGQLQKEKTERTALRYVFPQEMEALLFHNGFRIEACYGSWEQEPLSATSRYMIYVCKKTGKS